MKRIGHSEISTEGLRVNGTLKFGRGNDQPALEFLHNTYRGMNLSYPKFFKMDTLCKLGLLCAEPLLADLPENTRETMCILLANRASSLETDRRHLANIQSAENYHPSPSVFVYTLPNIVIGEICIRHKIMGEGLFFLTENSNFEWLENYASMLINTGVTTHVLTGLVESDAGITYAKMTLWKNNE